MEGDEALDVHVDGTTQVAMAQDATLPAAVPVVEDDVDGAFRVDLATRSLMVPLPLTAAQEGIGPSTPSPVREAFHVSSDGVSVLTLGRAMTVPWYAAMDADRVHLAHLFSWSTGPHTYIAFADDVQAYLTDLVPLVPAAAPFADLGETMPPVAFHTHMEGVAVDAGFRLARLTSLPTMTWSSVPGVDTLEAGGEPGVARAAPVPVYAPLTSAAVDPNAAYTIAAPRDGSAGGPPLPAQAASVPSVLGATAWQSAAAGAGIALMGLALYHLIRKNALLRNQVRSDIAEFVLTNPGSTITEIAKAANVTHQTASYHLRLLQEHGLVLGVERGNKRLYFRNDGSFNSEERGLVAVLRDPESMRVLGLIRENPWIMKNEAASALGVSRNTLNWHLQKLIGADLVSEARENGHCFLYCNRRVSDDTLASVADKMRQCGSDTPDGAPSLHGATGNGEAAAETPTEAARAALASASQPVYQAATSAARAGYRTD